jgi:hypothetical protein
MPKRWAQVLVGGVLSMIWLSSPAGLMLGIGCARSPLNAPTAMDLVFVIPVTIDQVASEYQLDPVKADSMYKGKRLVFNSVTVDELHKSWSDRPGAVSATIDYFRSGGVRFELLDFRGAQQRVQPGFVLKLDGICQGLVGDLVDVRDCWAASIEGDIGVGLVIGGGY